jgi:hypothetical protein
MAINQNHLFEELNGVKCAIVEKNATPARVAFLKKILETNHFEVVVIPSPPPKAAPAPAPKPADAMAQATPATKTDETSNPHLPAQALAMAGSEPARQSAGEGGIRNPESFTVGVTDVTFNPINAIFGRLLHTEDGHVVTLAYWQQKDSIALDDIPYYEEETARP